MRQKIFKTATYVGILTLVYLSGAFVAADIDFRNWDGYGRACIALLGLTACFLYLGFTTMND